MGRIVCPECQEKREIELSSLSKPFRCQCGEEFVPLLYLPGSDFPLATDGLKTKVARGLGYFAVGYKYRSRRFVVVRGSRFLKNVSHLTASAVNLRNDLIAKDTLRFWPTENCYIVEQDVQFDGSRLALSVIAGKSCADSEWVTFPPDPPTEKEIPSPSDNTKGHRFTSQIHRDTPRSPAKSAKKVVEPSPPQDTPEGTRAADTSPRPDFLALDSEHVRSLIVTVLERRPDNSVKRDELVKEVLREIDVRTSGAPRKRFEKKLLGQVRWLSNRNVVKEYQIKNRRIKLTDQYRSLVLGQKRAPSPSDLSTSSNRANGKNTLVDPYTTKALREQNRRLRKMVVLLSQELGLNVDLVD